MPEIRATARRLKATLLLDLAPFAALKIAELVGARTALVIEVGDHGPHIAAAHQVIDLGKATPLQQRHHLAEFSNPIRAEQGRAERGVPGE